MTTKQKNTASEYYEGEFAALTTTVDAATLELLNENMVGDDAFTAADLVRVTFPREGDAWQFEDAGVKRIEEALVGVPLRQNVSRTLYLSEYGGGNDFPDCASRDGVNGSPALDDEGYAKSAVTATDGTVLEFGGACVRCPLNQWESAARIGRPGRGKACTEYRTIALLEPESEWPLMVRLPPLQIKHWVEFAKGLRKRYIPISSAVVSLSIDGGELRPELQARLDETTAALLRATVTDVVQLAPVQESGPQGGNALPQYLDDAPAYGDEGDLDPDSLPF